MQHCCLLPGYTNTKKHSFVDFSNKKKPSSPELRADVWLLSEGLNVLVRLIDQGDF